MRIKYVEKRFKPPSIAKIETANAIISEYHKQGFRLTVRQLYYQFVARDLISNTQREYKNLASLINDARLAGLISWHAIEDRTRNLQGNNHWESPQAIIQACASQYMIDLWKSQPVRCEVWIEKDALAGVIAGICEKLDVSYFSCRGYTSQSEMWSAAMRLREFEDNGQDTIIFHLGDHDPSGIDMTRDIQDRLQMFGAQTRVERIALNMDQIEKYNPPPNPAKLTDSRSDLYVSKYGNESWELDALEPSVLVQLIEDHVRDERNEFDWEEAQAEQDEQREKLYEAAKQLEDDDND